MQFYLVLIFEAYVALSSTDGRKPPVDEDRTYNHDQFGRVQMNMFSRFMKDESGATAIEYGLIAAIVGVGLVTALGTLKTNLSTTFTNVGAELVKK